MTQSAGRGVGMDVVANEVKKLGGSLRISSVTGQGTNFTVRLPFTLAITQALIVRTGEEVYALPLPSVEGVARIPRGELENLLSQSEPSYQYGEQTYKFRHLGMYLGGQAAKLPEDEAFVPVILVRAGEYSAALLTDEMLASREIVVKSVGPQLASIRGIAGATILGDGRIVLILDINALVRTGAPVVELKKAAPTPSDDRPTRAGCRRFDHGAACHGALPAAQRHARADGEGRARCDQRVAGRQTRRHSARYRNAAHGRLRVCIARAQRRAYRTCRSS